MAFIVAAHRSAEIRRIVDAVLSRAGHTVVLFSDGARALAEISAGMPDVVVLGVDLAGLTGLEVRAAMRACAPVAGIPVVICGGALPAAEAHALRATGDLVVAESLAAAALRATVDTALAHPTRRLTAAAR